MKYLIVFFASLAMFSPLFLTGIRRCTGQKARRALGANIASFFACLILATALGFGGSASAAGESAAAAPGIAEGLKYIGAALAVGLSGIGGGVAVAAAASSALGAISENEKAFGKALIFVGLAEGVALYGLIVALLKVRYNTNETLLTLMLNYIVLGVVKYLQAGPWGPDLNANGHPKIPMFDAAALLPKALGVHIGWIIVLAVPALMFGYRKYSKQGYEIAVVGESRRTASYAGIKVDRVIIRTMALSGALCGLIGLLLTSSTDHTMTTTIVDGRGFTAVMVSWMAKFNPIIMIFVSLLLVVLNRGAGEISTAFGLNRSFADILTGIILFFIIGCEFFINYKVQFRTSGKKEA